MHAKFGLIVSLLIGCATSAPPAQITIAPVASVGAGAGEPRFACFAEPARATILIAYSGNDLLILTTPEKVETARAASPASAIDKTPKPDLAQTARIKKMMAKVSAARQLTTTRDVPGVALTRSQLIDRLRAHVDREVPPAAIADESAFNSLLGLLPAKFDYESAMYGLLEAELAGYYEPEEGEMFLAGDLADDLAEATLAHELVHALQDQHYDLKGRMKYEPGKSDAQSALQCLAEGDATSAMADIMIAKSPVAQGKTAIDMPDEVFVEQVTASMRTGPSAGSPRVMQDSLSAPYINGLLFVHALRRRGGWSEVDKAWERVPATTEQILHPDKWYANEPALEVTAPTARTLGDGWSVADTDSMGELSFRIVLTEWMSAKAAAAAAAHWGGDRVVLFRQAGSTNAAVAWHIRYDADGEHAKQSFQRTRKGLMEHRPGAANESDCALLEKWSNEILPQ